MAPSLAWIHYFELGTRPSFAESLWLGCLRFDIFLAFLASQPDLASEPSAGPPTDAVSDALLVRTIPAVLSGRGAY
jgi:hypothetical protein